MLEMWRRMVIGSAVLVYCAGLGCAGGMLVERARSASVRPDTQTAPIDAGLAGFAGASATVGAEESRR